MGEMRPHRLDASTADRLLSGEVNPDDAPPGYAGVAQLLDAAGMGLGAEGSAREAATVAAMQAAALGHLTPTPITRGKKMLSKVLTVKAAAVSAAVLFSAGSAAAATGSLPGGAQRLTSDVLANVGISVPGGNDHSNGHGDSQGGSTNQSGSVAGKDVNTGGTDETDGPNGDVDNGQCADSQNQADSGEASVHAAVTPSQENCTSVTQSGQGDGNTGNTQSTSGNNNESTSSTGSTSGGNTQSTTGASSQNTSGPTPSGSGATGTSGSSSGNSDGTSSVGSSAASTGSGNAKSNS